MTRTIFIFAVTLFSCRQPIKNTGAKDGSVKHVADTFSNLFIDSKISLDSLFSLRKNSSAFNAQDTNTSLLIGHLFNRKEKQAVLRYKENDSVSNILVLQQAKNKWDTIFSAKVFPSPTNEVYDVDVVEVADFNGDDIPDLKIVKVFWIMHPGDYSDLWLYNDGHFTKVKGFDSIISATYDKSTNLIYSYQSTGCADMSMYFGVFKIVGDTMYIVKEMTCDCCSANKDSCIIEVIGKKSYSVPYKLAYKYVPQYFAAGVKEKCKF